MPPADIPDFDSMTPEEVMAWMESLAKRQGAKEGFTTEANVDIAEIDPSTVEIDEPGYVPFGEETSKPAAKKEPTPAAPPPPPPAPEPEPEPELEPELEPMMALDLGSLVDLDDLNEDTAIESGGLAWLESLAADQGSGFPEMDLSALSAELGDLPEELDELEPAPVSNPLDWLGSLAGGSAEDTQIDFDDLEDEEIEVESEDDIDLASITDPLAAGIDPMLWLESLAKRQGAKSEELTTSADMEIPVPKEAADTGPGYAAFSVEAEPREPKAPAARPKENLDPAAWLESMAAGSAAADDEEELTDDAMKQALSSGADITPDQMEKFFERQLERGLSVDEPFLEDEEEFDPDAPPIPAELPDWLLEQVQPPDDMPETAAPPALVEDIVAPNLDLPDWLQMGESQETDLELESIFESTESVSDEEQQFFSSDPWVQAFTEEAETNPNEIPEWYERNLSDPKRIAAVEQQIGGSTELEEVELPVESKLPEGEPEAVPAWLSGEAVAEVEAEDAELVPEIPDWLSEADVQVGEGDIPDWLAAADVEVAPDEIPDWLRDTVETDEMAADEVIPAAPEPVVQAVAPPPARPAPAPAPAPVIIPAPAPAPLPVPAGEIAAVLESARTKAGGGDVDGSLVEYERVIRANAALDHVVSDLAALSEQHKENPAVYRVLGDGLMRQGKLQAALDTYRKALNQL